MKFDGIIFDIDGTIWDAAEVIADSWNRTACRSGGEAITADMVKGIMGMTFSEIAESLFSQYGDRAAELCRACLEEECAYLEEHGGQLYPGIRETVERLSRRYPLFIVSNCQDGYIQALFASSGMGEFFTDTECEGCTGKKKAENIRLVAERNGLKQPVYVGDTRIDEESCAQAGCAFIHAAYGFGKAEKPLAAINSPMELIDVLERLEKL